MKRQSSAVSPSSSRRENAPEKIHSKTIGCMTGILHLISNSQSRRTRRFLTFGKKQNKNNHGSSASDSTATANSQQPENVKEKSGGDVCTARNARLSCGVPRSPTLPADIRRSSSVAAEESRREAPALVAKLMGLEAAPVPASPESVSEKRQKLLGALQRCDEDLKALKKIIDAVRSADPLPAPSPAVVSRSAGGLGEKMRTVSEVKCSVVVSNEQQQPSPVSVLDEFMTRSPLSPSCHSGRHSFARMQQQILKKPGEEEVSSTYIQERRMTSEQLVNNNNKKVINNEELDRSVMWSKAMTMRRSVEEVCRDVAWGEKRELGRIGLALQDHICRDLIEEIVTEFGCLYTLPFEACKRRLCF